MIPVDVYVEGLRVKRGPDWEFDNQDSNGLGTIVDELDDGWVRVKWDHGAQDNYRIHLKQDLSLANDYDIRLLIKAKYPIGTVFRVLGYGDGRRHTVTNHLLSKNDTGWYFTDQYGYVYFHNNQWASIFKEAAIVSTKHKVPTLEGLKAMYPVGTQFRPVDEYTGDYIDKIFTVGKDSKLHEGSTGSFWFVSSHDGYIWNSKHPDIYAEIVSEPSEKTLREQLPDDGAVYYNSKIFTDVLAILIGLGKEKIESRVSSKKFKYLAWNNNSYWYCLKTEKQLFTHPLNIEEDEEEQNRSISEHNTSFREWGNSTYSYRIKESEVQRPYQQIRRPNQSRGIRFEGAESEESIRSNYIKRKVTIGRGEGEIEPSDLRRSILTRK